MRELALTRTVAESMACNANCRNKDFSFWAEFHPRVPGLWRVNFKPINKPIDSLPIPFIECGDS
jgi:hypothetical protein